MTTVVSPEVRLEVGDWVVDHPVSIRHLCYQVRSVQDEYALLRSLHLVSKQRFNCSSRVRDLALIRKKDGQRFDPPVGLGGRG